MVVGCVEFQDAFLRSAAAEGRVDPGLYLHDTESGRMCAFLFVCRNEKIKNKCVSLECT